MVFFRAVQTNEKSIELVCWVGFRNDISQKYVLFLACNRTMGCSSAAL